MRTSFVIYFLPIIMIGNALHAGEEYLEHPQGLQSIIERMKSANELSAHQDLTSSILENLEAGSSQEKIKTLNEEQELGQSPLIPNNNIIASLADLETQVKSQIEKKQRRTKRSIDLENFLKISSSILGEDKLRIHPNVFVEYANQGIQKNPKPGWLKRIFCCKCKKRKNPFEYRSRYTPHEYDDWSKKIFTIAVCEQAIKHINKKAPTRVGGHLQDIDEDEESRKIRDLEFNLLKKSLEVERLTGEKELDKKLQAVLQDQQQKKEKYDKIKELLYTTAVSIIVGLVAGALGIG